MLDIIGAAGGPSKTPYDTYISVSRRGVTRTTLLQNLIDHPRENIYVHPDDLSIIQKGLSLEHDSNKYQWIEDPLLTRGGLRLETSDTSVDATVESRLNSIISKVLGDERDADND